MSTQLYEVDVFMFFLKDLEAVTTNFYHDLWQSTRMHTPKVCSALCSVLFPLSLQPFVPAQCFTHTKLQQLDLWPQPHEHALEITLKTCKVT